VLEVFNKIEDQSKFKFFYQNEQIDVNRTVTVNVDGAKVEDILDKIFANENIKYRVLEDNLVLLTAEKVQQYKVTGTISSKDGQPLPGVSVQEKGTSNGAISDVNGKYSLNVQGPNSVLVFSFVGYLVEEKTVGTQTSIDVSMVEDVKQLEEIVVVGYGQQKKSLVTGAISSVKASDIGKINIARAEEALQGRTSGVQVVPVSGAPGAGMNIRIRGYSSNSNSNPLFIVDGTKTGDINYLDPNDIASMEVLKDAASSAIYGSEGGNGVVIITTKKGQAGKMQITYDIQHAFKSAAKLPKLMNTAQYAQFMTEKNTSGNSVLTAPIDQNYNTDWLNAIFENGKSTKHHLTFSGGNEKSNFLVGLSYFVNDGIVTGKKDNFDRYSVLFNSDHQITKWLKVGNSLDYSHFTTKGINENSGEFGGMIGSALQIDPTTPIEYNDPAKIPTFIQGEIAANKDLIVKAPNGNYYGISQYAAGEITNPFVLQELNTGMTKTDKLLGNIYIDLTPFKGFTFTSRVGLDFSVVNFHNWNKPFYYDATNKNSAGITHDNNDYYNKWMWENFATYARKFGDHNLTVLAGMSAEDYLHRTINGTGSPMAIADDNFAQLSSSSHTSDNVTGMTKEIRKESFFGRASYDYKGKYLLQASLRRDGAGLSQVPANGRWGTFPSGSVGWVMSNENFFPKTILSYAKLRASWGQNGSLNALDDNNLFLYNAVITGTYASSPTATAQPLTYPLADGTNAQVYEPNVLSNDKLTWETSQQTDIGIDLKALNDKLSFTVDYFVKTTKDMIFTGIPSYSSGNFAPQSNGGEVQNKGFEFEVGYHNSAGKLNYSIDLNISPLKNKVTKLESLFGKRVGGASIGTHWSNATMFEPGYPIWHFFGYKTNGIDPATGDPIFVTAAGNDTSALLIADKDRQDLGSAIPKFTYGGNIRLDYRGIDFSLTFAGAQGNKVLMGWIRTDKLASNRPTYFYDGRWTTPGVAASKPGANPNANTFSSDQYIFDGSFLRIQTIQLGYTLPSSLLRQAKINSLRLYVSLDNFFTFTKYPGMDPQPTIVNNNPNNIGVDRGTYPMAKDVMIGASISF
jgi:TonB-linked SusC/RagA family outer membrane protein